MQMLYTPRDSFVMWIVDCGMCKHEVHSILNMFFYRTSCKSQSGVFKFNPYCTDSKKGHEGVRKDKPLEPGTNIHLLKVFSYADI